MNNEDKKWILEVIEEVIDNIEVDYNVDYDARDKDYYVDKSNAYAVINRERENLESNENREILL